MDDFMARTLGVLKAFGDLRQNKQQIDIHNIKRGTGEEGLSQSDARKL